MQPYQPPSERAEVAAPEEPGDDIELARAGGLVKLATGALLLTGILSVLLVLQMLLGFRVTGILRVLLYLIGVLGLGCAFLGLQVSRLRAWSAGPAIAVAITQLVALSLWALMSLLSLVFSLLLPLAALASVVAAVATPMARADLLRAARARARLAAAGLRLS
ncbi:MAG: hypothetical protein KIT72_02515 [Polyangiaceae bacterium]|nr:hypothetical protein [Polyangiaceae bacterium]MCW5789272.1 hypothetical protein [Polyangiaceae bacterium]